MECCPPYSASTGGFPSPRGEVEIERSVFVASSKVKVFPSPRGEVEIEQLRNGVIPIHLTKFPSPCGEVEIEPVICKVSISVSSFRPLAGK